ncbi:hypothetical protein DsansV1_C42g0239041 [Dioscorea sansibarensis]
MDGCKPPQKGTLWLGSLVAFMAFSSSSCSAREPQLPSPENMSFLRRIFPSSLLPSSPSKFMCL